jgi:hypothetical protein
MRLTRERRDCSHFSPPRSLLPPFRGALEKPGRPQALYAGKADGGGWYRSSYSGLRPVVGEIEILPRFAPRRIKTYVLLVWIDYEGVYNGGESKRWA